MNGDLSTLETALVVCLVAPALMLGGLGLAATRGRGPDEVWASRAVAWCMALAWSASLVALAALIVDGGASRIVRLGTWFGSDRHAFSLDLVVDRVSLGFLVLALTIAGIDAAFSSRYLHRESGFVRYFAAFALFVAGISVVALAGSVELMFLGWEFLGLSSALLIGFFQTRRAPPEAALRVFALYRLSDAALFVAVVLLHHWSRAAPASAVFTGAPEALGELGPAYATVIGAFVLLAIAIKSALFPFSHWLPRAMEGPTSSSAMFYGALSIHAGCILLLRVEPLLGAAWGLSVVVVSLGLTTAAIGAFTARVQADIKSSLAYRAVTQVGLITAEIGMGWTTLAFVHIVGNASWRMLQFLGAPGVLHDLSPLAYDPKAGAQGNLRRSAPNQTRLGGLADAAYLAAMSRGILGKLALAFVVWPGLAGLRRLRDLDRAMLGLARVPHGEDGLDRSASGRDQ